MKQVPKPDLNLQDNFGCTALMLAIKDDREQMFYRLMMEKPTPNLNVKDQDGLQVIEYAENHQNERYKNFLLHF